MINKLLMSLLRAKKILQSSILPIQTRIKLIYLSLCRRFGVIKESKINLGMGNIILSKENFLIDYTVFYEIFINEDHYTDYRGALVVDIGAHKGYFGAYALLNGAEKVYSYEPEKQNFCILSKTTKTFENSGCQWIAEKIAIGSYSGVIDFYVTDQSWSHSIFIRDDRKILGKEKVAIKSFSELILDLSKVNAGKKLIIKINIEGAEGDVITKTSTDIWKMVDELFFSYECINLYTIDQLLIHLKQAGFYLARERHGNLYYLKRQK